MPSADSCHSSVLRDRDPYQHDVASRPKSSFHSAQARVQGKGRELSGNSSSSGGTGSRPSSMRCASEDSHSVVTGNLRSGASLSRSETGRDPDRTREVSGASINTNADGHQSASRQAGEPPGTRRRSKSYKPAKASALSRAFTSRKQEPKSAGTRRGRQRSAGPASGAQSDALPGKLQSAGAIGVEYGQ